MFHGRGSTVAIWIGLADPLPELPSLRHRQDYPVRHNALPTNCNNASSLSRVARSFRPPPEPAALAKPNPAATGEGHRLFVERALYQLLRRTQHIFQFSVAKPASWLRALSSSARIETSLVFCTTGSRQADRGYVGSLRQQALRFGKMLFPPVTHAVVGRLHAGQTQATPQSHPEKIPSAWHVSSSLTACRYWR